MLLTAFRAFHGYSPPSVCPNSPATIGAGIPIGQSQVMIAMGTMIVYSVNIGFGKELFDPVDKRFDHFLFSFQI